MRSPLDRGLVSLHGLTDMHHGKPWVGGPIWLSECRGDQISVSQECRIRAGGGTYNLSAVSSPHRVQRKIPAVQKALTSARIVDAPRLSERRVWRVHRAPNMRASVRRRSGRKRTPSQDIISGVMFERLDVLEAGPVSASAALVSRPPDPASVRNR